jgi:hypothetical protein
MRSVHPSRVACIALALAGPLAVTPAHAGESTAPAPEAPPTPAPAKTTPTNDELARTVEALSKKASASWTDHLHFSGYVQSQFVVQSYNRAASPNPAGVDANAVVAKTDGTTTNSSLFRIRRARLKTVASPSENVRVILELEPFGSGGPPGTGVVYREAQAVGLLHWRKGEKLVHADGTVHDNPADVTTEIGAGSFKIPFCYEILQGDGDRDFIERSWGERQMFPGEYDLGVHATTTALDKRFRTAFAILNGVAIGEKTFSTLPDLNRRKDLVLYANYNFGAIDLGAGGYLGRGQEIDASKPILRTFPRWAVNAEAALHHRFGGLGETRLLAEGLLGESMDRNTLPALPSAVSIAVSPLHQYRFFVRAEQEVTRWASFGLRYDVYSPDSSQAGNRREALSVLGVAHLAEGLKVMLEYDRTVDNTHKANAALPSKHTDSLSAVAQAKF